MAAEIIRRLPSGLCILAGVAGMLSACSRSPATAAAAPARGSTSPSLATLDLAYDKPPWSALGCMRAPSGLPAGKTVDLAWGTVTGGWVIEDYYHFRGKKYHGEHDVARTVPDRCERPARTRASPFPRTTAACTT